MSMADMLTYSAFGNEMLSLMMGFQDIIKYSFFKRFVEVDHNPLGCDWVLRSIN